MDTSAFDWLLNIDAHLGEFFQSYGFWAYGILFMVIFGETGFVVLPFLPGDTLLFAAGALAASGGPDLWILLALISAAATLGNTVNYLIGHRLSLVLTSDHWAHRFIKPHHLAQAHRFFQRWGAWAITLCRFLPILRTITPFVAGLGRMNFGKFSVYNAIGSVAWSFMFVLLGFFFGRLPFIKNNFFALVVFILAISTLPFIIALIKNRIDAGKKKE